MISRFYGKFYSIQSFRNKAYITKSGVSMLGISEAAESIGFRTRGYRITWEQLRDEVPLPCIVHWNQRHFVVVYKIKKQRAWGRERGAGGEEQGAGSKERRAKNAKEIVYVADPASGLLKYTKEEFCKCWYSTKSDGVSIKILHGNM
jgi:ATP-binding cassette subfamily B protein